MGTRIATYNTRQLGHYMIPIANSALDYGHDVEWAMGIKPIFEQTEPSTRYLGARADQIVFRFALDSQQDPTLNSDMKMMEQFEDIKIDITPLVGSKEGANLVITDGVKIFTYPHSKPKAMKKVLNIRGLMIVEMSFICPVVPTIV
mgnify:CR=1 FL=1